MRTLIAAVLVLAVCTPTAFARKWTDSIGKHTVEAEFVDFKDGKVWLKKEDGSVIPVPIERLSEADQQFVKADGASKGEAELVKGLTEIGAPFQQGALVCFDPAWRGIVGGDEDATAPRGVVLARRFGSGRIVAISENGFWKANDRATDETDNLKLLDNCFLWLDVASRRKVGILPGVTGFDHLWTRWEKRGFDHRPIPAGYDAGQLGGYSVLIAPNTWDARSGKEIEAIKAAVQGGAGLLMLGLGWSFPRSNWEYPQNVLGRQFGVSWLARGVVDRAHNLGFPLAPRFHTFYPQVNLVGLDDACQTIETAHRSHPADLERTLDSDPRFRRDYLYAHRCLAEYPLCLERPHPALDRIAAFYSRLASDELGVEGRRYFQKTRVYDTKTASVMAAVRERVYRTWIDCVEPAPSARAEIARLGGFPPPYRKILVENGVYLADNTSLDREQLICVYDFLRLVPRELHNLAAISVVTLVGDPAKPWPGLPDELLTGELLLGRGGAVNTSDAKITDGPIQNQFPEDVGAVAVPLFASTLAHELSHVIDQYTADRSPRLSTRKKALIDAAGAEPRNYLRSMVPSGVFQKAPQEFFASMANEWFADSTRTLESGLDKFDRGWCEPLNQALFFADVLSGSGSQTYFFQTTRAGRLTRTEVELVRDASGQILRMKTPSTSYTFTLDERGNVLTYLAEGEQGQRKGQRDRGKR
jgi:hypothetical protein